MITFAQFKTIIDLAEKLTDIQFQVWTKQEILDQVACNFDETVQYAEDNHFYAVLADGRRVDDQYNTCKKSELRTAYKITACDECGTFWFLSPAARKDGQLLERELESEVLGYLWEYIEEDHDYSADELAGLLKVALAEKSAA